VSRYEGVWRRARRDVVNDEPDGGQGGDRPRSLGQRLRDGRVAPSRPERAVGAALILAAATASGVLNLLSPGGLSWLAGGLAVVAVLGYLARAEQAVHLGLFLALVVVALRLPVGPWPLPPGVGVLAYLALMLPFRPFRAGLGWARLGRFDRTVGLLVLASVVVASTALVGWFLLLRPDVSDLLAGLPQVPGWQLVLLALGFSMLNAFVEETIYRGVLLHALDAALGAGWIAVLLQAAAFAMIHLHGFPRGWIGVGLATIYGVMMGVLRRRAAGMLAPWVGHVVVDVAVFSILVLLA
jgi:membrane protease YdiL (CAAX protease family)